MDAKPDRNRPWLQHYDDGLPATLSPGSPDLLSAFRHAVAGRPGAPLIFYLGTTLSFSDVDQQSAAFAAGLIDLDVAPGDRVAIYLQNIPQMVTAIIGAWKAGAVVTLINPMSKRDELVHLLNDSGSKVLVCLEELYESVVKEGLGRSGVEFVVTTSPLDFVRDPDVAVLRDVRTVRPAATVDMLELIDSFADAVPAELRVEPDSTALLTYTSGTTGPAKAAMNTHANAIYTAEVFRSWVGITSSDVILGIAPLFHITGLIGHFGLALVTGAPIILGYRFDAGLYLQLAERYHATFAVGAITAYTAWMNCSEANIRDLSALTKVYSGGQPVPAALVHRYEEQFGTYIHTAYGLTETTAPSHLVPFGLRAPLDEESGLLAVGVPVFGTESKIIGEDGATLPAGTVGEIVISGPGVVPGYWGMPEASAAALAEGWLRTGDVGYMREDGWFFVIDRMKDMINSSGFKVWPREVEDVLVSHDAIMEAAVVGVPDDYRGEAVKAFVSLRLGEAITVDELIAYCRARLAVYKCPRSVEIVADVPKNAAGKIVRRELRRSR